jgi:hypothetical protein
MMPPIRKKQKDGRSKNNPPKHYQFKPGNSGNKKGRPKKTPTVLDLVEEELDNKHPISVGEKHIQVTLKRLLIKQLLRLAMKGNTKALFLALEMLDRIQKTNAARYEETLRPRINREELKTMTQDQLTALYFEALKGVPQF